MVRIFGIFHKQHVHFKNHYHYGNLTPRLCLCLFLFSLLPFSFLSFPFEVSYWSQGSPHVNHPLCPLPCTLWTLTTSQALRNWWVAATLCWPSLCAACHSSWVNSSTIRCSHVSWMYVLVTYGNTCFISFRQASETTLRRVTSLHPLFSEFQSDVRRPPGDAWWWWQLWNWDQVSNPRSSHRKMAHNRSDELQSVFFTI